MSRPDCPSPVGSTDALQLHLVREVDRDGLRKTERLVEKIYKSDIANTASRLHKKPGYDPLRWYKKRPADPLENYGTSHGLDKRPGDCGQESPLSDDNRAQDGSTARDQSL